MSQCLPGASEAACFRPPGSLQRTSGVLRTGLLLTCIRVGLRWGSGEGAWGENPCLQDRGLEKPGGEMYLGIKGVLGAGLRETGAGRAGTGGA